MLLSKGRKTSAEVALSEYHRSPLENASLAPDSAEPQQGSILCRQLLVILGRGCTNLSVKQCYYKLRRFFTNEEPPKALKWAE